MTKVGLLSDTHGYWDEKYLQYFEGCDEIWHAGDIGSLEVAQKLAAFRPFRAVYGNIDGQEIRQLYPQILGEYKRKAMEKTIFVTSMVFVISENIRPR